MKLHLTDEQFGRLAELLHAAAGLAFDESRRESLGYSVLERMRLTGHDDVDAYLALLDGPAGAEERQSLFDEVTIPETHFFRNPPQIRALRQFVMPELLRQAASSRRLRVWSAGCSTGEEAYTIAMLVRELLPANSGWDVQVVATDISVRALSAARRGHYQERAFVMTDPTDLQRFFRLDADTRSYEVRSEIRDLVDFRHHNLVTDAPPFAAGEVDLVLCRNVTIYFDRETTKSLMQRMHATLRDGGYLFLGHAETLWQVTDAFSLVTLGDAFVYRRPTPASARLAVFPDRRTEDEPRPTKADRRRGPEDRRTTARTSVSSSRGRPAEAPAQPVLMDPLDAARVAVAAGRYAEAADIAGEVGSVDPLRQEAHYLQGLALTNLGRDADAMVVLRKAVYLAPDDGFAHFLLAGALERSGETLAAARSYRAAATTLGGRSVDDAAPELGGRSAAELADLCAQQAERIETTWQGGAA